MEQFETRTSGSFEKFGIKGPSTVEKIREALNFMRNQQFEVPFIAFYRKEYVEPELNINDLWRVWHFDEKVCVFVKMGAKMDNLSILMPIMSVLGAFVFSGCALAMSHVAIGYKHVCVAKGK
jgi:hypothetical protein